MSHRIGSLFRRKLLGFPLGDHLGVLIGYHYGNPVVLEKTKDGQTRAVYLNEFAQGQEVFEVPAPIDHPVNVLNRARSALQEQSEWAIHQNCDHLARWVSYSKNESPQYNLGLALAAITGLLILAHHE